LKYDVKSLKSLKFNVKSQEYGQKPIKSNLKSLKGGLKSIKRLLIAEFYYARPEFLEIGPKTVGIF